MKLKLDEDVHGDVRHALAEPGHDVATVRDEGLRGHPDADVLAAAREEDRCLVTLDLDFANPIRYPPTQHHGVVVLRLRTPTFGLQLKRLVSFFETQSGTLAGKLWILDETRARDWTPFSAEQQTSLDPVFGDHGAVQYRSLGVQRAPRYVPLATASHPIRSKDRHSPGLCVAQTVIHPLSVSIPGANSKGGCRAWCKTRVSVYTEPRPGTVALLRAADAGLRRE